MGCWLDMYEYHASTSLLACCSFAELVRASASTLVTSVPAFSQPCLASVKPVLRGKLHPRTDVAESVPSERYFLFTPKA